MKKIVLEHPKKNYFIILNFNKNHELLKKIILHNYIDVSLYYVLRA